MQPALPITKAAAARREMAIQRVRALADRLEAAGVQILVIGSLARGTFGVHSDVDLVVTDCPRGLKYAIEGVIEEELHGLPFDAVYLDETPDWRRPRLLAGARDARDLR